MRRITLEEARRFEAAHVAAYEHFGFELARIAPGDVKTRFAAAARAIEP